MLHVKLFKYGLRVLCLCEMYSSVVSVETIPSQIFAGSTERSDAVL